jgi:hypothetical protein
MGVGLYSKATPPVALTMCKLITVNALFKRQHNLPQLLLLGGIAVTRYIYFVPYK